MKSVWLASLHIQQKPRAITFENGSSYGTIIAIVRKTDKYLRFPEIFSLGASLVADACTRTCVCASVWGMQHHHIYQPEHKINRNGNNNNNINNNGTYEI